MRVAIITPEVPAHHKHFCAYLAQRHDVVAVVHPGRRRTDLPGKVQVIRRRVADSGVVYTALRALGTTPTPFIGWDWSKAFEEAESHFFPNADREYASFVSPLARTIADVNSAEGVAFIRDVAVDVVVCLGGPIYRPPLITACQSMINFHSGLSPLYNGASTIMFAFAHGHFHLCGGTLMTMSPVVDGGDILAHYLPALDANDTPATIFMKTVKGAAEVVHRFLVGAARGDSFTSAPQPPPLFTCTSTGWTVHHTHQVRRHLEQHALARYVRPERIIDYWASGNDGEAQKRVYDTVHGLLGWTDVT